MDLLYHDQSEEVMVWYRREKGVGGMGVDGAAVDEVPCLNLGVGPLHVECFNQ